MSSLLQNDDADQDLCSDDDEIDDGFNDDIEALRRACTLTGTNLSDVNIDNGENNRSLSAEGDGDSYSGEGEEDEDDFKLFRIIQNRFSFGTDSCEPIYSKPLCAFPLDFDDEEDDFETLCAVRKRFSAYDNSEGKLENLAEKSEGVDASSVVSKLVTSDDSVIDRTACKVFPDTEEGLNSTLLSDNMEIQPSGYIEQQHSLDACKFSSLGRKDSSSFPKSAQVFIDAIKKNRSCQKFLRKKLAHIEARIEENKKLKERVKILRDFQVSCKKITGRALAQGKDPRIQLISTPRISNSRDSKVNDKKVSTMHNGPPENSHVASYRMALTNFPLNLNRKNWTEAEKENLQKGIRQQFQEMVLQFSVDQLSGSEGSPGNVNDLDAVLASIREMEITPERIREFLPKVNWDQLASLYVVGRSGAECEAKWLNSEDPLINHSKWTAEEDKKLLFIVQEKGMTNWLDIAASLGKNRTPFQCLVRFQRSLNAHIIKREWTKEEDAQLRIAVGTYGEHDWQSVASTLEGRTGTQCSNRWKKSIHPGNGRKGKWTLDERKRLKVAVMLFGPRNWNKIARFVSERTAPQCRERWVNSEDPSLNMDKWTEEEDLRLKAAIEEYGYCWAKIAKCLPPRTDSQCRRRWKVLLPHEVPLLQAARKTQKVAIIGNFVDRESERPALGPHDFVPLPMITSAFEPEKQNQSRKHKRKSREGGVSGKKKNAAPGNTSKRLQSKRPNEGMQISSVEDPGITNGTEVATFGESGMVVTKSSSSEKNPHMKTYQDIADAQDGDPKKKKKLPKLPLKRNMLVEIAGNSQSCLLSHPESLELGISNVDGLQTFGGESETSSEKRKVQEQHSEANTCTNTGEEEGSEPITDVIELDHDHCDSNVLAVNIADQDETVGQPDASNKEVTNLSLEGKAFMELADSNCLTLPPENLEARVTNAGGVEKSSLDGISLIKASKAPNCTSKSSTELSGQCNFVVSSPCHHDGHRKSKLSKSSNKQVLATNDEDNGKLASFCQKISKKRRLRVDKNDKQILETNDEDDVTLASFCRSISKKKRVRVVKNADQTCPPSDLVSKRVYQHDYPNKMPSFMLDGEAQTCYSGGFAENVLLEEPSVVDTAKTDAPQEPMRKPISIDHDSDLEMSDITLASLLHNKQKRKGQVLAKSRDQPHSLSRMKKRSRPLAKGVVQCCNGRMLETSSGCEIQSCGTSSIPKITGDDKEPDGQDVAD
ncbi:hypothetical protein P3X46_032045 [Hevea brasiliensis]|uniref:Uncharacterized protein n=1 Tax=Hevea brasiliensis TaxID=3981 RepID=A0ABQ9KM97_HEVBR|nr:uncharacterized protein LOC110642004 isoform X2 [Hevea brasiliensis]KAJ9141518.1 hypothetical protein P3X46_032045 [Hevea brasiliensis]